MNRTATRALLALTAAALPACSFGFGSPYVAQWRARDVVDYKVCVEDDAGRCAEQHVVKSHLEPRKFWGFELMMPSAGPTLTSFAGAASTHGRIEFGFEYLRGHGRSALGLRISNLLDSGDQAVVSAPVELIGHRALADRISVYGGLGGAAFNRTGEMTPRTSHLGARALAGVSFALVRTNTSTHLVLDVEADTFYTRFGDDAYRSSALTTHLGIFL